MRLAAPGALLLLLVGAAAGQDAPEVRSAADDVELRTRELQRTVGPSVVSVTVRTGPCRPSAVELPGLTIRIPAPPAETIEGTGFLVSDDGHVVTTQALVRCAAAVEVGFADGTLRAADVVGADEACGVAVLRTRPPLGSRPLRTPARVSPLGDVLGWAFGRPNGLGRPSALVLSVRADERAPGVYDRYLSSGAALPPGTAGAPLVSREGTLLGMAAGAFAETADGHRAGALFVRADDLGELVADLIRHGHVRRGTLGVFLDEGTTRVDQLIPGAAAERAGLLEDDEITAVNGLAVRTSDDLTRALLRRRPSDVVRLDLLRDGRPLAREVVLGEPVLLDAPRTPPLRGAHLEVELARGDGDECETHVRFAAVEAGTPLARAGVQVGDELVSADGRCAWRFLSRHRVRPLPDLPARLEVRRDGEVVEIPLAAPAPRGE